MIRRFRHLAVACSLLLPVAVRAQPTIAAINNDTLPRSGRLSIQGSGFGSGGQVLIGGLPALDSTWTSDRIVAYVPEESPLGATSIIVDVAGQQSNAVPLTVTARQRDGRIRWLFEIDSEYIYYRPAQAPDGTLYVHGYSGEGTGEGRVFAISADGALKWIQKEVFWAADVPPAAGPDGAAYVGSIDTLYRISPEGQIDWVFEGFKVESGAVVGPDGTVYAGFEQAPEAVALDPVSGDLIWESSPGLSAFGTGGNEARLGRSSPNGPIDRLYLWWDALAGFDLDGNHLFTTSAGNIYDHEVGVGSDGTLYAPANFETDLAALSPFGDILWVTEGDWFATISDVEVGPDDTLYFVSDGDWLEAYDAQTQASHWRREVVPWARRPSLSPDGGILLTSGGGNCDSQDCWVSFIKAIDATDGTELWHLELNDLWDPDYRNITWDHARISADSKAAYFTGWVAGNHDYGDERSLLWAIDLVEAEIFSDGFESGDTSAWSLTVP